MDAQSGNSVYCLPRLFPLRVDPNGNVQHVEQAQEMSPIDPRDRDRDRDIDLESTGSFRRRYEDLHPASPPSRRVEVPLSLVLTIAIYLVTQLVGSIWWAATLQAKVEHEATDRAREEHKLWDEVQTTDLRVDQLEKKMDQSIRSAVREALADIGIAAYKNGRSYSREEN